MPDPAETLDLPGTTPPPESPAKDAKAQAYTGILPYQAIHDMLRAGEILPATEFFEESPPIEADQIQPASIDLRLGAYAYPVRTSFLPGHGVSVIDKMKQIDKDIEAIKIPLKDGAILEEGKVYVIPLMESIKLKSDVAAFANPKSSTGRLDILTRLIADGATGFDQVESGYDGRLYVEVAPRSFSIVVKTGTRLNQLRFRRSRGETVKHITQNTWDQLLADGQIVVSNGDTIPKLNEKTGFLPFTVDLRGSGAEKLIGWRAKKYAARIDLERRDYDPLEFWEPLYNRNEPSLLLDPDRFYILMTKESIAVPPDYAAEMLPYDTRAGEFRVHYAGFFDPGFGWNAKTRKAGGSRGVLEVRSREVPFLLEHGQLVGWLQYERMAASPDKLYGQDMSSNYQGQSLKPAKQFRP
jgi:dCTP deaminase